MVELRYFRRLGHAQHDPQEYVDPALMAEWETRDPIKRFHARILDRGSAPEDELRAIRQEVDDKCKYAAERAIAEPVPHGPEAVDDVYTDVPMPRPWTRA
jgi:TPP-dependent pyruvate/acetoin dehydrogenase alpha subunit